MTFAASRGQGEADIEGRGGPSKFELIVNN